MAVWYSLWSFVIFFPIWNVWTKKNLATLKLVQTGEELKCVSKWFFTALKQMILLLLAEAKKLYRDYR
jgi:hypothetical protein